MRWGIDACKWQRRFAWKPWRTIKGQWVWLEWVEVTGYVENRDVGLYTPYNCRIFSTSFAVRTIKEPTA